MRLILCFLSVLLLSCNGDKQATTKAPAKAEKTTVQTSSGKSFPSLPQALMMNIWDNGEMIDYIFHNLPFSMNQTELNSIRTNLTYIDPKPVNDIPSNCKPFARQFYQVGGNIILEADIYFSEGCKFYVFVEDGKEKYANYMAESGENFFNQMVQQAMQARQNAAQQ